MVVSQGINVPISDGTDFSGWRKLECLQDSIAAHGVAIVTPSVCF
jgi:hypothetical protein